ncbi:hypothetical protein Clacol_002596 [Clathrus columnatus]|uniref:J domain-containing protein n=1 Tax=Clathrus columnatus TaxID=1419009 RepID=A0AAV5A4K6_9AGAM|nr:hypothetical protein Clacol_002596 [Clathrus columnatus]
MPAPTKLKNYYISLGLTKSATYDDIKAAYRSLALQWHPDRHEKNKEDAARRFIEINEAYKFLTDPSRRDRYDNKPTEKTRGRHGPKSTATQGEYSTKTDKPQQSKPENSSSKPEPPFTGEGLKVPGTNIFSSTKAKSDPGLRDPVKVPGGQPQHATSEAGLHERYRGSHNNEDCRMPSSNGTFTRAKSEGNRSRPVEEQSPLPDSKSRPKSSGGKIEADLRDFIRRMSGGTKRPPKGSPSFSSQKATIYDDNDDGIPVRNTELYTTTQPTTEIPAEWIFPLPLTLEELYEGACQRYRITRHLLSGKKKDIMVDIDIGQGWKQGTKIRFSGAGNEREGGTPQDVVFIVEEVPHQSFVRDGSTLITHVQIPLLDALAGEGRKVYLSGVDGKSIGIDIPPGIIRPGDEYYIQGAGMPIRKQGEVVGRGDMIVRWEIQFPEKLTREQKQTLEKALRY